MFNASTGLNLVIIGLFVYAAIADFPRQTETFSGTVTWVSDGDTFKMSGHNWPIRVWGIDAPERDTQAGQTARDFLTSLIKGRAVNCEKHVIDKFRRTVATCHIQEQDIAELMLEAGHAEEFCSFTRGHYGYC